ncbi:MAG: hypothetical protein IJP29_02030 [Lachnospiraceae bacterium]|nr:hypothetical protein [Lachnospiraceae bacterium]
MKNKGLTVIEVMVVVVVILAIGALLFPVIVGYVNNCKMQADMETASKIATAMTNVLSEKKISENAVSHATPQLVSNMDGSDFRKAVYEELGIEEIKGYTKKNVDGELLGVPEFYYTLNTTKVQIEIYYGGITEEYKIYPKVGNKLVK